MKFIVSSTQLFKNLQQISGVLATNTVIPVLQDFLFKIQDNQLTVIGADLQTVVKVKMSVESREPGTVCIPARILLDSLKNIPEQPLTFAIDNTFGVEITSDTGKYKVVGESAENFPKDPVDDGSVSFTMPANTMHTIINKCLFATSADTLRPAMLGVFFELNDKGLTTVATDAHRLVKFNRSDVKTKKDASFIVPKKPLTLIKGIIPMSDNPITVSFTENHLFIHYEDSEIACRLIDARFPDYRVVIPAENPYSLNVNKSDFQNALRRVSVFSNKSTYQVALSIQGSELLLESQDIDLNFEGNERMTCSYNGEDMQIAFNAKFIIEMLSAIDTDDIVLELSTPTRPGIIKPTEKVENEDLLMLIMPLMINN